MAYTKDRGRYYTTADLGAKRSTTPEGFLVCHDVPVARTGVMLYGADETPIEPGPDGLVRIERVPEEVFRRETMASFEGKPVTLDHPPEFVTPNTWALLAKGVMQNVRRGTGVQDDLLLADLLITEASAIERVRSNELREVSCGYEAEYEQTQPGRGVQRRIVGNHVALVERGRCGPRCAIGDKEPKSMSTPKKKRTWMDRVKTAFKAQDQAALDEALEEAQDSQLPDDDDEPKGKTGDKATAKALDKMAQAMDTQNQLLTALVKSLKAPAKDGKTGDEDDPDGKGKKDGETDDTVIEPETTPKNGGMTVISGDAWSKMLAGLEILTPGAALPTNDAAKRTEDAACQCMRGALTKAMAGDAKAAVEPFLGGRDLSKLTADQVAAVFTGAVELTKANRNNSTVSDAAARVQSFGKPASVASINQKNKAFWADRGHR